MASVRQDRAHSGMVDRSWAKTVATRPAARRVTFILAVRLIVFRNSVSGGDVKETNDQCVLELAGLDIVEREQREKHGRPDQEYPRDLYSSMSRTDKLPRLGPAIVFRSSIGTPLGRTVQV